MRTSATCAAALVALAHRAVGVRLAGRAGNPHVGVVHTGITLPDTRINSCAKLHTPRMCLNKTDSQHYSAGLVVSTYMEDIAWLNQFYWNGNITVYSHDRGVDRSHDSKESFADNRKIAETSEKEVAAANLHRKIPVSFETIPNKGDEASAYLAYIIQKYNKLPEVTFFIQGHRCAAHAEFDMARALPSIRECFPIHKGYMDLNTYHKKKADTVRCRDSEKLLKHPIMGFRIEDFEGIWTSLFKQEFGGMPDRICWDSYAQFGVTRERIRRHPVSFYKKLFNGVMNGTTTMEFFWKLIFQPNATSNYSHAEEQKQQLFDYVLQRR